MSPLILGILAFVGVATLVGGAALCCSPAPASKLEDRLDVLTSAGSSAAKDGMLKDNSVLARPLDDAPTMLAQWFAHFGNFDLLFEQADTNLTVARLAAFALVMGVAGGAVTIVLKAPPAMVPVSMIMAGSLPMIWLLWRRKRRFNVFNTQLPDALEMMARALAPDRAWPSASMPWRPRWPRRSARSSAACYDEQNLGMPLDDSLRAMCERMPNLDLRFFVTAVILQRQTGGDLSEILDKIGTLIREPLPHPGPGEGPDRRRPALRRRAPGPAVRTVNASLQLESRLCLPALHRPCRQEDAGDRRGHANPGRHRDQENRGNQGVEEVLST